MRGLRAARIAGPAAQAVFTARCMCGSGMCGKSDICSALHITMYDLYDLEDPAVRYTEGEQLFMEQYRKLSPGHRMAVDQLIDSLLKVQMAESCPPIRKLTFYRKSLAAGIGDPTEFEDEGRPIFLYSSKQVDRADCVFTVNGDSMEPTYHNGNMVLVSRIPDISRRKATSKNISW